MQCNAMKMQSIFINFFTQQGPSMIDACVTGGAAHVLHETAAFL